MTTKTDAPSDELILSLVVPFFNEEAGIDAFFDEVENTLSKKIDNFSIEIICINDGSTDNTLEKLRNARQGNNKIRIIDFSRNFGKEAALTAGLNFAKGNIVIPIDSDLQHPPSVILEMIEKWEEGYEVVLAKRINRKSDRFIQRVTARAFYKISQSISSINIPSDVGDFRLMDRKVVDAINLLTEDCRFMKGIFAWVGFRTTTIEYDVAARSNGRSKFSTWKLWNFALDGITSFSTSPLRMWTYLGAFFSSASLIYGCYMVVKTLIFGNSTPGYASIMAAILFSFGIQLIGIGVLGEYLGRVFREVKDRPLYIVREIIE